MMKGRGREHTKRAAERFREARAEQPGPGGPVEAERTGVGETTGSAGDQNDGVNPVHPDPRNTDTVRLEPGTITESQIQAWREAEVVAAAGPKESSVGQREREVRPARLSVKERLMRLVGKKTAQVVKKKMEDSKMAEPEKVDQPLVVATTGGKGGTQTIISAGVLLAVIAAIRVFWPDLIWDPSMDAEMVEHVNDTLTALVGAVSVIAYVVGIIKNVFKNRGLLKNGVVLFQRKGG